MACERFETEGLLYLSGELEDGAANSYESHLSMCDDCRIELDDARALSSMTDKGRLFEVDTSPAMDAIIQKLCSRPVRPTVSFFDFSAMARRFALPVLFLAVGFGGGTYISVIAMSGSQPAGAVAQAPLVRTQQIAALPGTATPAVVVRDSMKSDSLIDQRRPLGNLNHEGVVPVNLGQE